ncbi:hypothetical protein RHMOL_Rhmol10G0050400 [Rhododendron molle]|nr:hypothetical protein RHMOL_Rhmol10G0050400 [Rhododendron molle]
MNSDGAYHSSRSKAAFGVIARDSGGKALWWQVGRITRHSETAIESWALCIACTACRN